MPNQPRRIVVIGTSCSGKTTLARALAERLNLAHIELDALHWGPNWTPREDFPDRLAGAIAQERWVADGNYQATRELLWNRADLIIWLDYDMGVVLRRALRRTITRAWHRSPLWAGNRESFRMSFLSRESILLYVLTTWRKRRQAYTRQFGPAGAFREKPHLRLRKPSEAERLIEVLGSPNAFAGLPAFGKSVQTSSTT